SRGVFVTRVSKSNGCNPRFPRTLMPMIANYVMTSFTSVSCGKMKARIRESYDRRSAGTQGSCPGHNRLYGWLWPMLRLPQIIVGLYAKPHTGFADTGSFQAHGQI